METVEDGSIAADSCGILWRKPIYGAKLTCGNDFHTAKHQLLLDAYKEETGPGMAL